MRPKRRGSALMMVLFLLLVLLILGMALLGKQALNYRSTTQSALALQAQGVAWAGLERCRAKLDKDINFPPRGAEDQVYYSYTETIYDLDGLTPLGDCTVTLDRRWELPPYEVLEIVSEGRVIRAGEVIATRTLQAELDVAPNERGAYDTANPTLWKMLNWTDRGSL